MEKQQLKTVHYTLFIDLFLFLVDFCLGFAVLGLCWELAVKEFMLQSFPNSDVIWLEKKTTKDSFLLSFLSSLSILVQIPLFKDCIVVYVAVKEFKLQSFPNNSDVTLRGKKATGPWHSGNVSLIDRKQ